MPGGEDWLFAPVHARLVSGESIFNGAIDLAEIAILNDSLNVREDNRDIFERIQAAKQRDTHGRN